jgi:uncharacterized protein
MQTTEEIRKIIAEDIAITKSSMLLNVDLGDGRTALFSNLTSAIGVADKELLALLGEFSTPKKSFQVHRNNLMKKNAIIALLQNGFLVPEHFNESMHFREGFEKLQSSGSHSFMFVMTMDCNFSCVYCYEKRRNLKLDKETADKCIEYAVGRIKEKKQESVRISFYGGEPLLEFEMIKYIMQQFKQKLDEKMKFSTGIVTNGSLLTKEVAVFLKENNCDSVQITLDGMPKMHNQRRPYRGGKPSFEDIVIGLKNALDNLPNVVLRLNLDKSNIDQVNQLLEFLKGNGIKTSNLHISFGHVHSTTENTKGYEAKCIPNYEFGKEMMQLTKMARLHGFRANFTIPRMLFCGSYTNGGVIFNPDGTIASCWEGVCEKDYEIGSIHSEPVFNSHADTFRKRNPMDFEKCRKCDIVAFCGGGCISAAKSENGTFNSVACPYYKENFKELVTLYIKDCLENKNLHWKVDLDKSV